MQLGASLEIAKTSPRKTSSSFIQKCQEEWEREESLTELKALLNMNKVNDRNGIQTTYRRHTEKNGGMNKIWTMDICTRKVKSKEKKIEYLLCIDWKLSVDL